MTEAPIERVWRGRQPYEAMWREQTDRRDAVIAGAAPEVLWLLEHDPVVTLGRRGGAVEEGALGGVPVVATERGGLATWHGPGQLVGYPILHLERRRWAIRRVVWGIEQGLIRWLAAVGVQAGRREGLHGVWVGEAKVAALGLHVRHGVTMHGFALNLAPGPGAFAGIVPCGIADAAVTSVAALTGQAPTAESCAMDVADHVLEEILAAHL